MSPSMARTPREVLNRLRWQEPNRLADAVITYADRTRPEGVRILRGSEIVSLERRYFATVTTRLPYYKILRIQHGEEVLYQR